MIDLGALRANAAEAARLADGRRVIAVVKADAYGHGAEPVARLLVRSGCSALATWSVGEATALRDGGIDAPLLVLAGPRDAAEAAEALARGLVCVLHDGEGRALLGDGAVAGPLRSTSRSTRGCGGWGLPRTGRRTSRRPSPGIPGSPWRGS
jgi:alanine racemase